MSHQCSGAKEDTGRQATRNTRRILIQFVGQIATVGYLRTRPNLRAKMPFRMRLFPLPALIALAGWLYVFGTSGQQVVAYGLGSLLLGLAVFAAWDRARSLDQAPRD